MAGLEVDRIEPAPWRDHGSARSTARLSRETGRVDRLQRTSPLGFLWRRLNDNLIRWDSVGGKSVNQHPVGVFCPNVKGHRMD